VSRREARGWRSVSIFGTIRNYSEPGDTYLVPLVWPTRITKPRSAKSFKSLRAMRWLNSRLFSSPYDVKVTKALLGYSCHYCTTPSVFFQANLLPSGEWSCRVCKKQRPRKHFAPFVCFVVQTCQPRAWRWLAGTGRPLGPREGGRRGERRRIGLRGRDCRSCRPWLEW
jgi:hypothetical protein